MISLEKYISHQTTSLNFTDLNYTFVIFVIAIIV